MNELAPINIDDFRPTVTSETITVTPDLARDWLGRARLKGRLDSRLIKAYARDMKTGRWKLNGEPLIFSDTGDLLAGRHRLNACIEADTDFRALIVRGIPGEAFETIDTLRRRTAGDILTIRKLPAGRQLAAALALIWRYYNGDLETEKLRVPTQESLHLLNVYPELLAEVGPTSSIAPARDVKSVIPLGMGIAFHFLFSRVSREKANALYQQIVDAEDGSLTDGPGVALYTALKAMRDQGGRRQKDRVRAYIIKAWNALYEERRLSQLKFDLGREKFPEIAGFDRVGEALNAVRPDDETPALDNATHDMRELSVEIIQITPERAEQYLENHPINRTAAEAVIDRYARDMRAGRWQVNGQTIKIASSGRLIDGQHRLKACIRAKRPFPALIVSNIDESAFDTFDLGAKKSYHIVLAERGEQNTTVLAAALKWIWLHERERMYARTDQPTPGELDDVLERNPEVRESLEYVNKARAIVAPGIAVAMHYLCTRRAGQRANEFFDQLCNGIGLTEDSPVYVLRERLIKERTSRRTVASEVERIVWIIKAWNAWITSQPMRGLSWRRKGPGREDIPSILGARQ